MGEPIRMPSSVITPLPYMALSKPPWLPGGGVICVKIRDDMPASAVRYAGSTECAAKQASPVKRGDQRQRQKGAVLELAQHAPVHTAEPTRRSSLAQHGLRQCNHREGDQKQQQSERDQGRGVKIAHRFGEFIGNGRGNGGAGRQQRGTDAMRVADHEGHRHGLAERAAQTQHDAADDADARMRHDHVPNHFPGRGAEPVAGFLEHRRHGIEHIAHGGRNERQHHDGEHHAGGENADAVGRTLEQAADGGNVAQMR